MRTAAVDFESYYDNECSLTTIGNENYLAHPDCDVYLVSVAYADGPDEEPKTWVGHPREFDWSLLRGAVVVSHNAAFDELVYRKLATDGVVPAELGHDSWECSADLVAYCGFPRSLAAAAKVILKLEVPKTTRASMKKKRWEDMTEEFRKEVCEYALRDAVICLKLWQKLEERWPGGEKALSKATRQMGWYGVCIDRSGIESDRERLLELRDAMAETLPWVPQKTPLSRTGLFEWLAERQVDPPVIRVLEEGEIVEKQSFRKDAESVQQWVVDHPQEAATVKSLWAYRSAHTLSKKLESMLARQRPDGRMGYGLYYCGAHTLRDTGGGGVNMQNLPRAAMMEREFRAAATGWEGSELEEEEAVFDTDGEEFGVSLRSRIIAAPGHVLVAGDLSAIEPKSLAFIAKDFRSLEAAKTTADWYEARARAWGLYTKPEPLKEGDPALRTLIKTLEIGLGYGMGVGTYQRKTGLSLEKAVENHANYRLWNPEVVEFWKTLNRAIRSSVGKDLQIRLHSGRNVVFRKIRQDSKGNFSFLRLFKHGYMRKNVFAGFATENLVQAFARDVYMDRVLAVIAAGLRIVLRVHDEIVCEVPVSQAEEAKETLHRIMTTSPSWAPNLPLASSVSYGRTYAEAK